MAALMVTGTAVAVATGRGRVGDPSSAPSSAPASTTRGRSLAAAPVRLGRAHAGPPARLPASTYRRRRVVAAGLAVVLVLAGWLALGTLGGGSLAVPERPRPSGATTYVVQPGDTFWSIARAIDPKGDPRPLVDRLVAAHGGPVLHVGERLPLPDP